MSIDNKCFKCGRPMHPGACAGGGGSGGGEDAPKADDNKENAALNPAEKSPHNGIVGNSYRSFVLVQNPIFRPAPSGEAPDLSTLQQQNALNEALKDAANIILNALKSALDKTPIVTIGYDPGVKNPNFRPTPSELDTYSTFQKQTGLSITINGAPITDQQLKQLKSDDAFKKSMDKISVLSSGSASKAEQSAGAEKVQEQKTSSKSTSPWKSPLSTSCSPQGRGR